MSKAQTAPTTRYTLKAYDRIEITVPKGNREIIAQAAAAAGMSVNAFIKEAIEAQIAKQSA